jgi:hypothetical protein
MARTASVKSAADESSESSDNPSILRDFADENKGPTVRSRMLGDSFKTSGGPRMDCFPGHAAAVTLRQTLKEVSKGSGPTIASISTGTRTIQKMQIRIFAYLFLLYVISCLNRSSTGFPQNDPSLPPAIQVDQGYFRLVPSVRACFESQKLSRKASWIWRAGATKLGVPNVGFSGLPIPSPNFAGTCPRKAGAPYTVSMAFTF